MREEAEGGEDVEDFLLVGDGHPFWGLGGGFEGGEGLVFWGETGP